MNLKELYKQALENEAVDLYTLIMFLIFEKKALNWDDDCKELDFYFQDKFRVRMNQLEEYKKKMNIHYKPNVYKITAKNHHTYRFVYIVAMNEKQATSYALSQLIEPLDISLCDVDMLMTKFNKRGDEFHVDLKTVRDKEKVPAFLGGF